MITLVADAHMRSLAVYVVAALRLQSMQELSKKAVHVVVA
jgi:hypothetical protein